MPEVRHTMTNSHCSLQLGVLGHFEPLTGSKAEPCWGFKEQNPGKLSRSCSLHLPKMPKIHPRGPFTLNYNFMNFFIKVIKSSTEAAVTNIIASLSVTLDKKN